MFVYPESVNTDVSRLKEVVAKLEIPISESDMMRVRALKGELESPQFGLTPAEWSEVSNTASIVYHVAAYVNHYLAYEDHRAANVLGTLNVLRLVATGLPKILLHVRQHPFVCGYFDFKFSPRQVR